jgi:adenosylcobyric acid synthase
MKARALFVGGTSSNAGKSWMATAICAALRRRGVSVAPFKAQNMSNNSYPCRDGGEIGRAQVAQAEACGLEPERAMNPILLKPNGDGTSQVIVNGHLWKTLSARRYYEHFDVLVGEVMAAYQDLARRFHIIVIEGAGSVSELNLRTRDLANLGLVTRLDCPWVLVADIERGGVFASVLGTIALLSPDEHRLFRGFMINKFRGDQTLFDSGVQILEKKSGSPCLGVFPYAEHVSLDAEDSLALDVRSLTPPPIDTRTAIVHFPRISNATDFRLVTWADWIAEPRATDYDFVILPGSKDTIADLEWLRARGLEHWMLEQHRKGATVIGICGGFQMMGQTISDPDGVESITGSVRGLALLPIDTVLAREKTTRVRRARTTNGTSFSGYEIHLGATTHRMSLPPFAHFEDGTSDGACGERAIGTYLHGALENADVCSELFGVRVDPGPAKEAGYGRLADWLESHCRRPELWLDVAAEK